MTELLPKLRLKTCDFAPRQQRTSRFGISGQSITNQIGPGYWVARIETDRLNMDQARIWSSWLARRQGDTVPFLAWRLFRFSSLNAPTVLDQDIGLSPIYSSSSLQITNCGAYSPRQGDMISYRTAGNGYYIGEVVEDADCTAQQNAVQVQVWPLPQPIHQSTPDIRRTQAIGEFVLTNPPDAFEDYSNRSLRFEARQIYR